MTNAERSVSSEVTFSLAAIQRPGLLAHNCKLAYSLEYQLGATYLIQVLVLPRRDKTIYTVNIVSSQLSAWALVKLFARLFEGSAYEKIARDERMIPLILRYIFHL